MLIEIHMLQNHAPSNLNRGEDGEPKSCVFGGVTRARISSQCLKRSIRRSDVFQETLVDHLGLRTRRLPELVRQRVLEATNSEELAEIAAKKATGFGTKEGKERNEERGRFITAQTMFLSNQDIEVVSTVMLEAIDETNRDPKVFGELKSADLQNRAAEAGYRPITADIALFGRMTTSSVFHDVQASCQVAHALGTHATTSQWDYYTAVDDLMGTTEEEEDPGADMIGDVAFNSSCYYKYFSIDVEGLVANLTGESVGRRTEVSGEERAEARALAANAARAFLSAASRVTPTGKQNSFAAHNLPSAILVEIRPRKLPVSYANAFLDAGRFAEKDPVAAGLTRLKDFVEGTVEGFQLEALDRMIFAPNHMIPIDGVDTVPTLEDLELRIENAILHGEAADA